MELGLISKFLKSIVSYLQFFFLSGALSRHHSGFWRYKDRHDFVNHLAVWNLLNFDCKVRLSGLGFLF